MSLDTPSWTEPHHRTRLLADIAALPTEDDLPSDDGEPMETPRHRDQMISLIYSLKTHWANRTNYYVSGNMFLYYDPQSHRKFRGPHFFLVLDVDNHERKSWVVWQEGMRFPDLIIELLSDTTRETDTGEEENALRASVSYLRVFICTIRCRRTLLVTICKVGDINQSRPMPKAGYILPQQISIW